MSAFLYQLTLLIIIMYGVIPNQIKINNKKEWKMCIGGQRFTATTNLFEVATKKNDLDGFIYGTPKDQKNRKDHHFIWIGVINQYSRRKVEMQQNMVCVQTNDLNTIPSNVNCG